MKSYIGTKIINAEPCTDQEFKKFKGQTVNPDEVALAGYKVEYEDGYVSWSPQIAFDKAYRPATGCNFGLAFEAVRQLKKGMRLPSWAPDVVIRAQFPDEHSKMTAPYLYVESRFGKVPWKETMIELFSDKWEIVE